MSDYGSYSLQGFWFQPDPVALEDAKPFANNGYLEKYWDLDSNAGNFEPAYNMFENYYNIGSIYDNTCSYDDVIDNFKKQTGESDGEESSQSSSWTDPYFNFNYDFSSGEPSYDTSMFDPYYNIGGDSGANSSAAYNSSNQTIEDLRNQLSESIADESCINLDSLTDYDSYFNSIFS